jgi:hypothetical protein
MSSQPDFLHLSPSRGIAQRSLPLKIPNTQVISNNLHGFFIKTAPTLAGFSQDYALSGNTHTVLFKLSPRAQQL